jgi:hypothetical protein
MSGRGIRFLRSEHAFRKHASRCCTAIDCGPQVMGGTGRVPVLYLDLRPVATQPPAALTFAVAGVAVIEAGDISMRKLSFFVMVLSFFFFAGSASATTFYIDYASGSDANSGTSKSAPWMHAPGMQGCSAVCASTAPKPADSLILKGGVTWPNSSFQWDWSWSGSSGSPIYIGVDTTWFTGGSWARPILNAQGSTIGGNNDFINMSSGLSYVTIDNIEFTGMFWAGSQAYGNTVMIDISSSTNITIENCYFHNWTHGSGAGDDLKVIQGSTTPPYNTGTVITNCTFTGLPGGSDSGMATYAVPEADHNIVHDMTNGILVSHNASVHDNTIYNILTSFDSAQHENAIESTNGGTSYIYNNLIHDTTAVTIFVGGGDGSGAETDYIFDNVIYNSSPIPIQIDTQPVAAGTAYVYNNTIEAGSSSGTALRIVDRAQGALSVLDLRNNHYISDLSGNPACYSSGSGCANVTTVTDSSNLKMTHATAASQGFTSSEAHPYSPTATNNSALGAGIDLTSRGIAALDSDILGVPRPSVSAWDVGAYLYSGAAAARPQAPTGITATAN